MYVISGRVRELWSEFTHDCELFEDRREYGEDDFAKMYDLTLVEASSLWALFRRYEKGEPLGL
jgi:hypothetical protein